MLLTTYNDLSSMPLFSPFGLKFILFHPSAGVLVLFVDSLVVKFNVVGCGVVFGVVLLVVVTVSFVAETPE